MLVKNSNAVTNRFKVDQEQINTYIFCFGRRPTRHDNTGAHLQQLSGRDIADSCEHNAILGIFVLEN